MTYFQKNSLIFLLFTTLTIAQDSENQVYGFITDSTSGEALIGANVFIRETGQGMATDNNGYYVLSEIQLDEATLIVSYVGYEQYQRKIDFKDILIEPFCVKSEGKINVKFNKNIFSNVFLKNDGFGIQTAFLDSFNMLLSFLAEK